MDSWKLRNEVKRPTERGVHHAVRWSAFSSYAIQGGQLCLSVVVARLVAPEDFGVFVLATVITGFVSVFKTLGFGHAVIQRENLKGEFLSTLFWSSIVLGACLTLVVLGLSLVAAWIWGNSDVALVVAALSGTFVIQSVGIIPAAILKKQLAFDSLAIRDGGAFFANASITACLAGFGWGTWALVCGTLVGTISRTILILHVSNWRPDWYFSWTELKSTLSYSLNVTGTGVFSYLSGRSDDLLVGSFLGTTALAYYSMGYKFLRLARDSIGNVVAPVLFPTLASMQHDDARLRRAFFRACGATAMVMFPLMLGLASVCTPFVAGILGQKWLPIVPLILMFTPIGMAQSVGTLVGQIYLAKGRADLMFRWNMLNGALKAVGFCLGLKWGVTGVAASYCIVSATLLYPSFWIPFRLVNGMRVRDLGRTLAPYVLLSGVMTGCVTGIRWWLETSGAPPMSVLAVCVPLGVVVYSTLVLLARPPALDDFLRLLPDQVGVPLRRRFLPATVTEAAPMS